VIASGPVEFTSHVWLGYAGDPQLERIGSR
jgi:hypothetical protein